MNETTKKTMNDMLRLNTQYLKWSSNSFLHATGSIMEIPIGAGIPESEPFMGSIQLSSSLASCLDGGEVRWSWSGFWFSPSDSLSLYGPCLAETSQGESSTCIIRQGFLFVLLRALSSGALCRGYNLSIHQSHRSDPRTFRPIVNNCGPSHHQLTPPQLIFFRGFTRNFCRFAAF